MPWSFLGLALILFGKYSFEGRFLSIFGPTDEVRSYGFALVRQSVSQSVSQSGRFHSNGSLEFSDFWYQGSFLLLLKTDGARFSKTKFFWPKMAK